VATDGNIVADNHTQLDKAASADTPASHTPYQGIAPSSVMLPLQWSAQKVSQWMIDFDRMFTSCATAIIANEINGERLLDDSFGEMLPLLLLDTNLSSSQCQRLLEEVKKLKQLQLCGSDGKEKQSTLGKGNAWLNQQQQHRPNQLQSSQLHLQQHELHHKKHDDGMRSAPGGIENNTGENNCFLSTIIQALYRYVSLHSTRNQF
jgi:hypothetical protein